VIYVFFGFIALALYGELSIIMDWNLKYVAYAGLVFLVVITATAYAVREPWQPKVMTVEQLKEVERRRTPEQVVVCSNCKSKVRSRDMREIEWPVKVYQQRNDMFIAIDVYKVAQGYCPVCRRLVQWEVKRK